MKPASRGNHPSVERLQHISFYFLQGVGAVISPALERVLVKSERAKATGEGRACENSILPYYIDIHVLLIKEKQLEKSAGLSPSKAALASSTSPCFVQRRIWICQ